MLKTHKLSGEFAGMWACSIDCGDRVLFEFVANPEKSEEDAILPNLGDHDDVD